jgi:ADP-heptose:LPS heptosyltransferase
MSEREVSLAINHLLEELRGGGDPRDRLSRICDRLAAADGDESARLSTEFFARLIEPLCDSFLPSDVAIYNRVFAQVIDRFRRNDNAARLDRALRSFGLETEDALRTRAGALSRCDDGLSQSEATTLTRDRSMALRRIVILSRVTLGADAAITSVIAGGLQELSPGAEIVLVGGSKLPELFAGNPRVRSEEVDYRRSSGMLDRLLSWTDLLEQVKRLTEDLTVEQYLIVDTDSRLTQLGLLPLVSPECYLFFPSRVYQSRSTKPLSALASEWLAEITGSAPRAIPSLSLLPEDARLGKQLVESLRGIRATQVVTVNFGVGGNAAKRISEEFETELVANLLGQRMRVVLDKGAGEEEVARADRIISRLRHASNEISVAEITEENLAEFHGDFDLVSWTGRIGLLASMIDASDLYIGYDSAGQHVAAALGTPCIDVFAGASSELFRRRWSPTGPAQTRVIEADGREAELALRETLDAGRELLQR